MLKKYLEIGKIVGTHGIHGDVKVDSWCDSPDVICKLKKVYKDGNGQANIKVITAKPHKNQAILKLEDINTVELANTLRGTVLYADREDIKIDKDSYFIQDIIGLKVYDVDTNTYYGTVSDVFFTGANDVYEITDDNNKKYLIPVIPSVVIDINIEENEIKLRPIKGIFDDED